MTTDPDAASGRAHAATPGTVSYVPLDPDLARRLANAGRKSEEWREKRDELIREAAAAGGTLREIASLVGLSNPGVLRVIRRGEGSPTVTHESAPQPEG